MSSSSVSMFFFLLKDITFFRINTMLCSAASKTWTQTLDPKRPGPRKT